MEAERQRVEEARKAPNKQTVKGVKDNSSEDVDVLKKLKETKKYAGYIQKGAKAYGIYKLTKSFLNGTKLTFDSKGRIKWGQKFIYKDGHVYNTGKVYEKATDLDFSKYHLSKFGKGLKDINWKNLGKAAKTGFKDAVNPISDFKGWSKVTTQFKDGQKFLATAKGAGKFLGIVGTGFTIADNFGKNIDTSDGVQAKEVRNFAIDTGVDIASGAGAAAAGAAAGSLFLPPLGTVVGAVAGVAAGYVLNDLKINGKSITGHVKSAVKNVADGIGNAIGGLGKMIGFGR